MSEVHLENFNVNTRCEMDVVDITRQVEKCVSASGLTSGIVNVFVQGSTAAISTIEYEEGLARDLETALERIAPKDAEYLHHLRWHDDNGRSHVRATIIGPSITVPFENGRLVLGTWQQIVLVELDTHGRTRKVYVTVMGR
ncbi:MAG: secondary thiamine-phosphate synthase enzyme YjbQ [Thermoplasmata archaeon]